MQVLSHQLARHLREVYVGKNWTWVNLREQLADVTYEQATTSVYGLNTIAALTYHVGYFVQAGLQVLQGKPLTTKDAESFDHPPIHSETGWDALRTQTLADAAALTFLIEQLPEQQLWETFAEPTYETYFRNLLGIIEHTHYHLGQIVVIKRIISQLK
jgi:uncharacterized damage-inducible protein DinB